MIEVYDIVDSSTYLMSSVEFRLKYKTCQTNFSLLKLGRMPCTENRLILNSRRDELIKVLKSAKTGKEYECVTRQSLFLHLNYVGKPNELMGISLVLKGKSVGCSVDDDVFYLKENESTLYIRNFTQLRNSHLFSEQIKSKDLERRISGNIRSRLRGAIKRTGRRKKCKSTELLGCSFDFLMGYLESQFEPGMTWENHGFYGWHVDHIIPCNTFNLTDEEEQKKCFHYTNLRPLWAKENWSRPDDGSDMQN